MTSGECFENRWFYMKDIGKYLSVEILLTCIINKQQKRRTLYLCRKGVYRGKHILFPHESNIRYFYMTIQNYFFYKSIPNLIVENCRVEINKQINL